ncbi:MAG TPA: hypothetical protein VG675_16940 [Bryobacteraceae bacterium]|nr:hypothetical protein [Bryobacteraceae bacterium]
MKFRVPSTSAVAKVTVNGRTARIGGIHNDTAIVETGTQRHFEVVAQLG